MITAVVVVAVVLAAAGITYVERKIVAADARKLRAKVAGEFSRVIADAKAEAEKLEADVIKGEALVDGRVKRLISDIEATFKKAV
jgi:hypothetical protein